MKEQRYWLKLRFNHFHDETVYWRDIVPNKNGNNMNNSIQIMVVDDNALLRLGLTGAIGMQPGLEVAGMATSGKEALEYYQELKPDIVTMDYQMPGMNGIECTEKILESDPNAKIILLSAYNADEDVWRAVQAGVKGYLTKKAGEVEEVLDAIKEIAAGGTYFPADIARKIDRRKEQRNLTQRELDVLHLLVNGMSNKEIAHQLGISIDSVKQHVTNLREKLDAADRTQAAVEAIRRGIIQLDD